MAESSAVKKRRSLPRKKSIASAMPKVQRRGQSWLDEILSVTFFILALFLLVSFLSFKFSSERLESQIFDINSGALTGNLMGPVGHFTGTLLAGFLGWCSLVAVLWAGWFALYFWNYEESKEKTQKAGAKSIGLVLLGFAGMLLFSCGFVSILGGAELGGSLGSFLAYPLKRFFGTIGSSSICFVFFLVSVALATRTTLAVTTSSFILALLRVAHFVCVRIPNMFFNFCVLCTEWFAQGLRQFYRSFSLARQSDAQEREELPKPRIRKNSLSQLEVEVEKIESKKADKLEEEAGPTERMYDVIVNRRKAPANTATKRARLGEIEEASEQVMQRAYEFPLPDILTKGEGAVEAEDDNELRMKSQMIESKLKDFNIHGRVTQIHPGPVITLFEFEPAPGVKVGKIAALQDDLAMGLRATSIRIIAPIPRRGTVGIEVPNRHRDIVRLRDLLESEAFQNAESILSVPLGKDTSGDPVIDDIASMPHLLMAGATGTGKSVCINALLLSFLYRASPEDLGLILIDPKILELSVYEDIPHLRVPVVVDPRQARAVLQWAVNEMNRRYRVMQRFGVRNVDGYNRVVSGESTAEELREKNEKDLIRLSESEIIEEGEAPLEDEQSLREEDQDSEQMPAEELKPLPKIVIVIDELADLMFSAGREVEELITRLAQKARASGIHLIVATQRPSVDVITGLIKANFPARLSFRVSSRIDSRTILDGNGAEKLLGRGDILYMQPGAEAIKRIHGAYVSDSEVKRVVEAVKKNGKPKYDQHIMQLCEKALEENAQESGGAAGQEVEYDPLYDKAVELVVDKGQASTSMIQRVFRIGYNRAARMIEVMEKDGVIGPMDGVKPREVLVQSIAAEE